MQVEGLRDLQAGADVADYVAVAQLTEQPHLASKLLRVLGAREGGREGGWDGGRVGGREVGRLRVNEFECAQERERERDSEKDRGTGRKGWREGVCVCVCE